jgi:outer membrane protein W
MTVCGLRSQTVKDLNTPARVKALYEINEQRKAYKKQSQECEKDVEKVTDLAVSLGEESEKFLNHNLDLQGGLLTALGKIEKLEKDNATLKAKKPKPFGIGVQIGYGTNGADVKPYVGAGISYNFIRF